MIKQTQLQMDKMEKMKQAKKVTDTSGNKTSNKKIKEAGSPVRKDGDQSSARRTKKGFASETESNENEFERPNTDEKPSKAMFDSKDIKLGTEQKKDGKSK